MNKNDDDSLEGSFIVGTDLKLIPTNSFIDAIPKKPFVWRSLKSTGLSRQAIQVRLEKMEEMNLLKSKLELVEFPNGRKTYMRVYQQPNSEASPSKKKK